MSALFRSEFYTRMKRYWGENISIYDSKVKLFLKQEISRQLGRGWTQFFDLNARIQQLTWSLIFYEKYSTNLWFWPPLIFGGFSNFCRYYTRSQMGKSTGYQPTLKPLTNISVMGGCTGENHRLVSSLWPLSHNVVSSAPNHEQDSNSQR